ncbi:MAG: hypothetical protein A2X34_08405 [Elusimicrobia bacterium GWC2_51_8]|nr:MAG: hypothetical protein A2X33_11570 [Elusimicrobia bacterium GWA2_51_34]OGR63187.1 MAG: hypothetical protein A2X34_08405 [Elusimicrobia bacterium GWC2_51_8]HAF96638.1 hypothetical protein [Elusimicrobiota bacterium]HCE97311.1 hypothetical protein [Elusimicrobiota bacterium]
MGIDFKINITRKIIVNGKEYGSLDEVPEEHRHNLQNAMGMADTSPSGKFIVNGVGYDSPDAMPPEVRKIHDEAFMKARAMAKEKHINLSDFGIQPGGSVQAGGLSLRTTVIIIVLAALFLLAKFF